jgi:hypothetical protein
MSITKLESVTNETVLQVVDTVAVNLTPANAGTVYLCNCPSIALYTPTTGTAHDFGGPHNVTAAPRTRIVNRRGDGGTLSVKQPSNAELVVLALDNFVDVVWNGAEWITIGRVV